MMKWLLAVSLAACSVDAVDDPDFDVSADGAESASAFNADPFKPAGGADAYACIDPRASSQTSVAAHFFDGTTAFFSWRSLDWSGTTCKPGQLRVARWERLTIGGQRAYVMRGGGGTNADEIDGSGGIRFAHVLASELAKDTSIVDVPGRVGRAPAACAGKLYTSDPARGTTAELSALYYKPDQPASSGAKWDNYGDQAGSGPTPYTYMLWTWPVKPDGSENAGGGQIRAVIATGTAVRACNVAPAYLPMYRAGSHSSVGRFKMIYGRIRNADAIAYGWVPAAWQLDGGAWEYLVD